MTAMFCLGFASGIGALLVVSIVLGSIFWHRVFTVEGMDDE